MPNDLESALYDFLKNLWLPTRKSFFGSLQKGETYKEKYQCTQRNYGRDPKLNESIWGT